MPSVEELEVALAEARAKASQKVAVEPVTADSDPYAPVVWGGAEYDYRTPSGQLCRLRRLPIEELAKKGILNQISRLPGLTAELVTKSQGLPPEKQEMPTDEHISVITEVVNKLTPIVVVAPKVWPLPEDGEERVDGRVYVDSIDFTDRVAIMHRVVGPLTGLDSFRDQSGVAG
jgi:hypothetical protein